MARHLVSADLTQVRMGDVLTDGTTEVTVLTGPILGFFGHLGNVVQASPDPTEPLATTSDADLHDVMSRCIEILRRAGEGVNGLSTVGCLHIAGELLQVIPPGGRFPQHMPDPPLTIGDRVRYVGDTEEDPWRFRRESNKPYVITDMSPRPAGKPPVAHCYELGTGDPEGPWACDWFTCTVDKLVRVP